MPKLERLIVALAGLLITWLFFAEYLPPFKTVHVWSDIEGYHHPLLSYMVKSFRAGRIPLWDPFIYSGISFAGNIQAGVFYPPNWLLALMNPGRSGVRFVTIEILAFLHVWLTFLFAYLWLRERTGHPLPAAMGGAVAGYSGYMLSQMVHLGVACGYAWTPLGLWGIDQASRTRSWRPLWKLAVASALCIAAGYPPTFAAFAAIAVAYAATLPWRSRLIPLCAGAFCVALLLSAVVLLPTLETAKLKLPEVYFGGSLQNEPRLWWSLLVPNYFDQNRLTDGPDIPDGEYLYLGLPALFGLLMLPLVPPRNTLPALAIAGVSFLFIEDPYRIVARALALVPILLDVFRKWNFLMGLPLAAALFAANGVAAAMGKTPSHGRGPVWIRLVFAAVVLLWCGYLLFLWPPGGPEPAVDLGSAVYACVGVVLLAGGLLLHRKGAGALVAAAVILLVFIDLKVFGTNRKFNAVQGRLEIHHRGDARIGGPSFIGIDDAVYRQLLADPGYRIALAQGPHATDMRHYNVATPQGFDPFLPLAYRQSVERFVKFHTNRLFDMDPANEAFLREFGVGYAMVRKDGPTDQMLGSNADFELLQPSDSYFRVYRWKSAQPMWRFDGNVRIADWSPEVRTFEVSSNNGGKFVLLENFFPGWTGAVDGQSVPLAPANVTFQSVQVPAGRHTVRFAYRPLSVYFGGLITVASALTLTLAVNWRRRNILKRQ